MPYGVRVQETVGDGLPVARKPNVVEALAPRIPFHEALVTV